MKNKGKLIIINEEKQSLSDTEIKKNALKKEIKKKIANLITTDKWKINSKNKKEKSRNIDGIEYKVSDLFWTDKIFKNNYIKINNNDFKNWLKGIWSNTEDSNYIEHQTIMDDISKNWDKGDIIEEIIKKQYNPKHWENAVFEFLKDSWLVKLNWDKIDKSELTSWRNAFGDWYIEWLGNSGSIWLRALDWSKLVLSINFKEDSAYIMYNHPGEVNRIASQK